MILIYIKLSKFNSEGHESLELQSILSDMEEIVFASLLEVDITWIVIIRLCFKLSLHSWP